MIKAPAGLSKVLQGPFFCVYAAHSGTLCARKWHTFGTILLAAELRNDAN